MAQSTPLRNPAGWGSIQEVVNAPLIGVTGDETWCSVIGFWIFLLPNLVLAILSACCCSFLYVFQSIGSCCVPGSKWFLSAYGTVMQGSPLWLAFNSWRYSITLLLALVANGASRLGLFTWEWKAFGNGKYFWHGEGVWSPKYEDVDRILRDNQRRYSAFGCVHSCIPDLFATDILIFLSNEGPESQWAAVRQVLHNNFFDMGADTYKNRLAAIPGKLNQDWPNPQVSDFDDAAKVQRTVAKCIFWMMFGVWITEDEASMLTGWRTNAGTFILPRLVQRVMFNTGINKVKQLRVDTVNLVEKYDLQSTFMAMNNDLPARWIRTPSVKFCDEIMYVIGFAGIGGTAACVETCGAFLQTKRPKESAGIDFAGYDTPQKMQAAYKANPDAYIKECCRVDPPVTSATASIKVTEEIHLGTENLSIPSGTLNQYVLSLANRDPDVFPAPNTFNPARPNLNKAFTWNGAGNDESLYPRLCPGRYLSVHIAQAIIDHVLK